MFRNAKIGDRVWSFNYGWGNIIKINPNSEFSICVKFNFKNYNDFFTYEGFRSSNDKNPSLFWEEIKFTIPEKPFDLKDWLKENFNKKEFKIKEDNYYLYLEYSTNKYKKNKWKIDLKNYLEQAGAIYFDIISNKTSSVLEKELNNKNITIKMMNDCLKELGWL